MRTSSCIVAPGWVRPGHMMFAPDSTNLIAPLSVRSLGIMSEQVWGRMHIHTYMCVCVDMMLKRQGLLRVYVHRPGTCLHQHPRGAQSSASLIPCTQFPCTQFLSCGAYGRTRIAVQHTQCGKPAPISVLVEQRHLVQKCDLHIARAAAAAAAASLGVKSIQYATCSQTRDGRARVGWH